MDTNALDNCRPAFNSLAAGDGQFVHHGRIDSHTAGNSGDRGSRAHHSGSKPSGLAQVRVDKICRTTQIPEEDAMNKDRVEGKVKDIAGRVERQAGEWTGNPKTQAKGTAKQIEGKFQNAVGKVKDAVKRESDDPETGPVEFKEESEGARHSRR
jgi:uncharacterized protein YjbJ (UPF0337 family)